MAFIKKKSSRKVGKDDDESHYISKVKTGLCQENGEKKSLSLDLLTF